MSIMAMTTLEQEVICVCSTCRYSCGCPLGCRDGEEEFVNSMLSEEEPILKLAADMFGCGCVAFTCWAFCAFCHIDPLGMLYDQCHT